LKIKHETEVSIQFKSIQICFDQSQLHDYSCHVSLSPHHRNKDENRTMIFLKYYWSIRN